MTTRTSFLSKTLVIMLAGILLSVTLLGPAGTPRALAEDAIPEATDQVVIHETVSNGFTHPGVGVTKAILENMREQVMAGNEPWYSYYAAMTKSPYASRTFTSSNQTDPADPTKPRSLDFSSQGYNSRFIADGLRAYTQALMYYTTGDEVYRYNAMRLIRTWSRLDPAQYSYFTDAHIHTGIPLNRMVTAAEILRYSNSEGLDPDLLWTDADTANFTNNLIHPVIDTFQHHNGYFMNQHLYPLLGAMAGYIFTDNTDRYKEGVEWFTVNKTALDQGQNGSIKQLFRLVTEDAVTGEKLETPRVQHVEMGRDQAHGAGDITNAEILGRLLDAQGTRVDPEDGTYSTADDAVNVYEFLGNRILKASDYFARYMLGYDTPWTPVVARYDADGKPVIYKVLSGAYRGRIGGNVYGQYYYYKYNLGVDVEKEAPYLAEMFNKRTPYYWESPDGGADYWMFIPKEAAAEGASSLPKISPSADWTEIDHRATSLDGKAEIIQEGDTAFVRVSATEAGSRISVVASGTALKTVALKIRTNGTAKLEVNGWNDAEIVLPDTKGQWKYITLTMDQYRGLGDLIYFKITGQGVLVDIDHLLLAPAAQLTPPVFTSGPAKVNLYAYTGSEAALEFDFSAKDQAEGDRITYQIDPKPEGADFNESTGEFSWTPELQGVYEVVVSATDGTSVAAKAVNITVSTDRQTAAAAAAAPYNPETSYISSTVKKYQAVYEEVMNALPKASDQEFYGKLAELNLAVQGLKVLTPVMADGSMRYFDMVETSTFGTQIGNLIDHAPDSFAGYYLADNLSYILDFGEDFKVSATAVALQVRTGFPEPIGGAAVYGSNDKEIWTRLTPGLTVVSDDLQTLEVSSDLQDKQFRFMKLQMIEPSSTMFELSELRIYGLRHETNNKLKSVTLSSPQSVQNRVNTGNTAVLSFESAEPLQDVEVTIQGQPALLHTTDKLHWTATIVMNSSMKTGKIKFAINYKTADGSPADPAIFTTDRSSLYYVNKSRQLDIVKLAKVTASSAQYGSNGLPADKVGYLLFDGDTATFGDLANGSGAYYTIDFGQEASVRISDVILMPRAGYAGRTNGLVIQGSNDQVKWTALTPAVSGAADNTWTYINTEPVADTGSYRYLRIYNPSAWSGNITEAEFYGEYKVSPGYIQSKVQGPEGYTRLSYYLYKQEADRIVDAAKEQGADMLALLNQLFQSEKLLVPATALPATRITVTEDMVTASGPSWDGKLSAPRNGWMAFDGNTETYTDTKSNPGWIVIDLGEGKEVPLASFKFYPRSTAAHVSRVNGGKLQGSADGVNYEDLHTISGVSAAQWYTVPVSIGSPFRYLRYYSQTGNANVGELAFYSGSADTSLLDYLIAQAQGVKPLLYSEVSLAALAAAKTSALGLGETAPQAAIDTAASALDAALEGLEYVKDVPVLLPVQDKVADAEQLLTFMLQTANKVTDTVYSAANLPEGALLNPDTGVFSWTPAREMGGEYRITFTAAAKDYSTSVTVKITVRGMPQIAPDTSAELTAGQPFSYQVKASDPAGQPLFYQAVNMPAGAVFDAADGTFAWTPKQADYGTSRVTFIVSNAKYSASQSVDMHVGLQLLSSEDYTRGSYYLYDREAERIISEIVKPEADKQQLISELNKYEQQLVRKPLSLYSFEQNTSNTYGASAGDAAGNPAYTEGKNGQAIKLDGSTQYVQLPAAHALAEYDEITVGTWVYWESGSQWQRIFDFGNNSNQYMFLTPRSGSNTLRLAVKNGGGEQMLDTAQLPANQWVHVAVTLGGGTAKLYVNGAASASGAMTIKPSDFSPEINYIGKSQYASDPLFSGKLDEFVIYGRVLNPAQIEQLYQGNLNWLDDSLLVLLLNEAEELDSGKYTAESIGVLHQAMDAAEEVLGSAASSQQQMDASADVLLKAIEQLVFKPVIVSLKKTEVTTSPGTAPQLPKVVEAVYRDKSVKALPVIWADIDPAQYSTAGNFTVTGAVYDTALPALAYVTVISEDAPTPPSRLQATFITPTSLTLGWTASTGHTRIAGYDVLRNGEIRATVSGDTYEYGFTGLSPDTAYTFRVVAFDDSGHRSSSTDYTVTTLQEEDLSPPTVPAGLIATSVTTNSLTLGWKASSDNVGVARYELYKDDTKEATVTASTYSYSVPGLAADTAYTFRVAAFDSAGNTAESEPYTVRTAAQGPTSGSSGNTEREGPSSAAPSGTSVTGNLIRILPPAGNRMVQVAIREEDWKKATSNAVQNQEDTLRIQVGASAGLSVIVLELPAGAWLSSEQKGIKMLSVESGLASLKIPLRAVGNLNASDQLTLSITKADRSGLSGTQSAMLKDNPVCEFGLTVNGKDMNTFTKGSSVKIAIPYSPQADESVYGLVAADLNKKESVEVIRNSRYNSTTGMLEFAVMEFSKYAVFSNGTVFSDMDSYAWAKDSVTALSAREIVEGTGGEAYTPGREVTRAEFLKMLLEAFGQVQTGLTPSFTDVVAGQWYADAVATAVSLGIVTGYEDGSFGADRSITREELAVMTLRMMKAAGMEAEKKFETVHYSDKPQISGYAAEAVSIMTEAGFIQGQGAGRFAPKARTTRAEAAVVVARMMGWI